MTQNQLPIRRRPSSGVHISMSDPTIVWLTVCTKDRKQWLACDEAHKSLIKVWGMAEAWKVGRYVLMPNHLHLFCAPNDFDIQLKDWVRYWKSQFTRTVGRPEWRWQSRCWDTRIRRHESYTEKWAYALQNPVRAGLVVTPGEWLYQGELNELRW